jgi:hypothetical protein
MTERRLYTKDEMVAMGADGIRALNIPDDDPDFQFTVSRKALRQIASNESARLKRAPRPAEPPPDPAGREEAAGSPSGEGGPLERLEAIKERLDEGRGNGGDAPPVDVTAGAEPGWIETEKQSDEPDEREALRRLSRRYKQRINFLNNKSLDQTITDKERTELDVLYQRYHELAEKGIRS